MVDLAVCQHLARSPDDGARAGALAAEPAVQHGADGQRDRRNVDGGGRHQAGGRGLVAADGEHDAVDRVAVQDLDQAEVGEIAVEAGGRSLAGFLDGMNGELDGDAAGLADSFAQPLSQHQVVAVARREIGTGLRDADDRPIGLQLSLAEPEIHVALEIERRHVDVVGVVEPGARAQRLLLGSVDHACVLFVNRHTVVVRSVVPGSRRVDGKCGWFGLSGKCWLSNASASPWR